MKTLALLVVRAPVWQPAALAAACAGAPRPAAERQPAPAPAMLKLPQNLATSGVLTQGRQPGLTVVLRPQSARVHARLPPMMLAGGQMAQRALLQL